ncbi:MAG: glycosyltransferase family 8 protein [Leeuwenhoekiella sp.]
MNKKALSIFYVVDENYVIPFTVSLTSLLENNKKELDTVYVIHDIEQSDKFNKSIDYFKNNYEIEVRFIKVDASRFEKVHVSEHISKASYYRFLLPDLLPEHVEDGLYIDCDTVVTSSLEGLRTLGFEKNDEKETYALRAVQDIHQRKEIIRLENTLNITTSIYFNAGILLINIKKWRKINVARDLMDLALSYGNRLTFHDQDVLNIYFRDTVGKLDMTFNGNSWVKYQEIPCIIHYIGIDKPWHFIDNGPNKYIYKKYQKLTPFYARNERITLVKILRKYVRLVRKKLDKKPLFSG